MNSMLRLTNMGGRNDQNGGLKMLRRGAIWAAVAVVAVMLTLGFTGAQANSVCYQGVTDSGASALNFTGATVGTAGQNSVGTGNPSTCYIALDVPQDSGGSATFTTALHDGAGNPLFATGSIVVSGANATFTLNSAPSVGGTPALFLFIISLGLNLDLTATGVTLPTGVTVSLNNAGVGNCFGNCPSSPTLTLTQPGGTFDGFGSYNASITGPLGHDFTNGLSTGFDSIHFTLTLSQGQWLDAADVLTKNDDGHSLASHIGVQNCGLATNTSCTGFAAWPPPSVPNVPEPGTLTLLGSGVLALGAFVRRFRK